MIISLRCPGAQQSSSGGVWVAREPEVSVVMWEGPPLGGGSIIGLFQIGLCRAFPGWNGVEVAVWEGPETSIYRWNRGPLGHWNAQFFVPGGRLNLDDSSCVGLC